MWSYSGGAIPATGSTAIVGDALYADNVVTNSSPTLLLYCGSIQSINTGTSSITVTYENIKFANNICSGVNVNNIMSPGKFTNGFRFSNNNPNGTVIQALSNVEFIGNTAGDNVGTRFKFDYSVTGMSGTSVTTGVVLMENNTPMPSPAFPTGSGFGLGGGDLWWHTALHYHDWHGTGLKRDARHDDRTRRLDDVMRGRNQPDDGGWIQHQDNGEHPYHRDRDGI